MNFKLVTYLKVSHSQHQEEKHREALAKLGGSIIVLEKEGNGSYTSVDQDRKALEKQWNAFHVKLYYV